MLAAFTHRALGPGHDRVFLSSGAGDEIRFERSQEIMVEGGGCGDARVNGMIKIMELHSALTAIW